MTTFIINGVTIDVSDDLSVSLSGNSVSIKPAVIEHRMLEAPVAKLQPALFEMAPQPVKRGPGRPHRILGVSLPVPLRTDRGRVVGRESDAPFRKGIDTKHGQRLPVYQKDVDLFMKMIRANGHVYLIGYVRKRYKNPPLLKHSTRREDKDRLFIQRKETLALVRYLLKTHYVKCTAMHGSATMYIAYNTIVEEHTDVYDYRDETADTD